jgi:hypothetical protein
MNAYNHTIDLKKFGQQKHVPLLWKYMFIKWTWWKTKPYRNFKVLKFWRKGLQGKLRIHFLPLGRKIMFNGFKMFSFKCRSHVRKIILLEHMFVCPLKLSWGFFGIFYVFGYKPKYWYELYMYVKNHHHHMNYLKLDYSIFFSFKLFQIKVIYKK